MLPNKNEKDDCNTMTQLKDSPQNPTPIFICFTDKKFEVKTEIIQFSPLLMAAHEHNAQVAQRLKETDYQPKTITQAIQIDELLADIQPISVEDVFIVFHLLDTIYNSCKPRADGGYIAQQIQSLIDFVLVERSNMLISNICLIAEALNIPLLLNAFIGTIFAKPNIVSIIAEIENVDFYQAADAESIAQILFNMDFRLFSQPRILKLLKKHYFLKKNDLEELSVADYIEIHGQPGILDGLVDLCEKNLTSLYGIDQIASKDSIASLFLGDNFLEACIEMEDADLFAGFTHLKGLSLSGNRLTNLPNNFFKHLNSLALLKLSRNRLTTIDPTTFQELTHLKALWLDNNHIQTLPANIFKNLLSLEMLSLESNCLDSLDPAIFCNLVHFKKLDLRNNELTSSYGLGFIPELILEDHDPCGCPGRCESATDEVIISYNGQKLAIKPEIGLLSCYIHRHMESKEITRLDELLASTQLLSFAEVTKVFSLLQTIHSTLIPRKDGDYIAQQVQLIVDHAFQDHEPIFIGNVCRVAYKLGIIFLVNACASTIVSRFDIAPSDMVTLSTALALLSESASASWEEPILKLLTKHFLLKKNNLQELNVADYLYAYSQPAIENGVLSFENKKLTSLYGLYQIADKESVVSLRVRNNFLYDGLNIKGLFSGFTNLQVLDLARSNLIMLPDLFHNGWGIATLKDMRLSDNQLKHLDSAIFLELDNLEMLDLSYNVIETLPANVFEHLISLDVLRLNSNTNLQEIDPDAFIGLRNLRVLDLAFGDLSELPSTVFDDLKSLNNLDLRGNQLQDLDPLIFSNLFNLEILDLRNNNLEILPPTLLSQNPLLEELYLGENRLTSIESMFERPRHLRILSLGHVHPLCTDHSECCHLMECCHDYECCDKEPFDTSVVKNNSMNTLPKQLFNNFCHLEELDLNSLGLTHLDQDTFSDLTTLKSLNLSNNELKTLPAHIFKDLRNLETLDLRYNKLLCLDTHIFDSLQELKELKLCHNLFSHIPKKLFQNLKNLELLAIEHDNLKEFDLAVLEGLTQLKTVLLSN